MTVSRKGAGANIHNKSELNLKVYYSPYESGHSLFAGGYFFFGKVKLILVNIPDWFYLGKSKPLRVTCRESYN